MNQITSIVADNPVAVLTDPKTYSEFFRQMKAETDAFVPDLSTVTSRGKISALAYKIVRTKTAIDAAGKKLNEESRAKINAVDEQRRKIREELDALADGVRAPLTKWEEAEKNRVDYVKAIIRHIEQVGLGMIDGERYPFPILFRELDEKIVIDGSFGEYEEAARAAMATARNSLNVAFEAHQKAEADRIELEKLRKEAAERAAAEASRIAAEKAERDRAEAEEAKAAAAKKAAEAAALREAQAAENARIEERRKADAALAKAEAEKRAIIQAQEDADRRREAEASRLAKEQADRDADKAHRATVMKASKKAIIAQGADEELAKKIVLAIVANEIPHVTLRF